MYRVLLVFIHSYSNTQNDFEVIEKSNNKTNRHFCATQSKQIEGEQRIKNRFEIRKKHSSIIIIIGEMETEEMPKRQTKYEERKRCESLN